MRTSAGRAWVGVGLLVGAFGLSACRPPQPVRPLQDRDPIWVIPAIGTLGAAREVERAQELVPLLDSDDAAIRLTAINALRQLTGEDFGYAFWADAATRAPAVARWQQWVEESGHPPPRRSPRGRQVNAR